MTLAAAFAALLNAVDHLEDRKPLSALYALRHEGGLPRPHEGAAGLELFRPERGALHAPSTRRSPRRRIAYTRSHRRRSGLCRLPEERSFRWTSPPNAHREPSARRGEFEACRDASLGSRLRWWH